MKAQYALEYLMIIAITLMVILPATYLFSTYSRESLSEITDPQVREIGRNIIGNSESVYFSGESSKMVMDVRMPPQVSDIYILYNRELVFKTYSEVGDNELVFFSDVNITSDDCVAERCSLSALSESGVKKIKIESVSGGRQVKISKG